MRKIPPLDVVGLVLLCVGPVGCGYLRSPRSFSGDEIAARIRELPEHAHLSLSGVAFFRDKLYVTSNVGCFVLDGARLEMLYKWYPSDDVVEGPWVDVANDALWIQHYHDGGTFRRFDGTTWHFMGLPVPPKGYSRGDMMDGFVGVASPTTFWVVGGGAVWRFQPAGSSWVLEPTPPAPEYSATRAVAPLGSSMLYVVREGFEGIRYSRYAVYDRENSWARQNLSQEMDFGGLVATDGGAYVRARDGRLFSITPSNIQVLETPGTCEAITRTSTGKLLASFVDRGIFVLEDGRWELEVAYPYGEEEGEHWARLAESKGQIAYATTCVPQLEDRKTVYSGSVALWVKREGKLERVPLN